jgi:hypothetical protein
MNKYCTAVWKLYDPVLGQLRRPDSGDLDVFSQEASIQLLLSTP